MKIQKFDKSVSSGAKINVKTEKMQNFMQYLNDNTKAPDGWYNSKNDLFLIKKILKAFKKHPSPEEITPDVYYIQGVFSNARGTLESSRTKLTDTEPARSDSIAPLLNIFRRIIDPENKESFIKLTGEEYSAEYGKWWNENIAPIWKNVRKSFRETTFFEHIYDKEFNADFNQQGGNFWIKLWKNIYG